MTITFTILVAVVVSCVFDLIAMAVVMLIFRVHDGLHAANEKTFVRIWGEQDAKIKELQDKVKELEDNLEWRVKDLESKVGDNSLNDHYGYSRLDRIESRLDGI